MEVSEYGPCVVCVYEICEGCLARLGSLAKFAGGIGDAA